VWDYSEHGTGTQGQLPQKCRKNAVFFQDGVENAAVLAAFCCAGSGLGAAWYSPLVRRLCEKIEGLRKMVSGTSWNALEQRISSAKLPRRPVAVGFLEATPSGLEQFQGTEPSGCSFWRLATAGRTFLHRTGKLFQLRRGAYTHNIPRSPAREKETGRTLKIMAAGLVQCAHQFVTCGRLPSVTTASNFPCSSASNAHFPSLFVCPFGYRAA
jgi:hypothetical protein